MLKRQYVYYAAIAVIAITLLFYFVNQERNKVPYALGVDAIKDTTDMAGTYYRIRVTNIGTNILRVYHQINRGSFIHARTRIYRKLMLWLIMESI
jgi:hypothetical protein